MMTRKPNPATRSGDSKPPIIECVNCGRWMREAALFCSDLCHGEAELVRYARRCRSDGRLMQSDIRDVIKIKMAHILSGGYDWRARQLSPALRAAVIQRDGGLCRSCGEPGTEIDHVTGPDNSLSNLQLLCRPCHTAKTKARLRPLTQDDPAFLERRRKGASLQRRIMAPHPLRPCDDHEKWPSEWPFLLAARKVALENLRRWEAELLDDFGYSSWDDFERDLAEERGHQD